MRSQGHPPGRTPPWPEEERGPGPQEERRGPWGGGRVLGGSEAWDWTPRGTPETRVGLPMGSQIERLIADFALRGLSVAHSGDTSVAHRSASLRGSPLTNGGRCHPPRREHCLENPKDVFWEKGVGLTHRSSFHLFLRHFWQLGGHLLSILVLFFSL